MTKKMTTKELVQGKATETLDELYKKRNALLAPKTNEKQDCNIESEQHVNSNAPEFISTLDTARSIDISSGTDSRLSSETLLSSVLNSSETLLSSVLNSSETLLSSVLNSSETLLSSETLPVQKSRFAGSETLLSSETLPNKTLLSSETLPNKTLLSSETLLNNDDWSNIEKFSPELFFLILDAGIYELLPNNGTSASILFYWAFTIQRSSFLSFSYDQAVGSLGYSRTRVSRTLDHIRENDLFEVRTTHQGVFIDIRKLIKKVDKSYPHSDLKLSSETLLSSSSSTYKDLRTTTTNLSSVSLLIKSPDLKILADIISYYGFVGKDLNPKLIDLMSKKYREEDGSIENIAFNIAYAAKTSKNTRSLTAYLIKTITEGYGATSLSYAEREKVGKIMETFREVRSGRLDELGASELRKMLFVIGKPLPEHTSRIDCEAALSDILSRSNDLYEKMR
jgi:hypothetical protein